MAGPEPRAVATGSTRSGSEGAPQGFPRYRFGSTRSLPLAVLGVALALGAHALQAAGPLRLGTDSIDYLAMAASAVDGRGFTLDGEVSPRPIGYPAVVAALEWAGLAAPWALVLLNCACLALGLWAAAAVLRRALGLGPRAAAIACLVSLLSFVAVKHSAQPLSDVPFLFVAAACLLLATRAEQQTGWARWRLLGAAVLAAAAGMALRKVGIMLVPALAWVAATDPGVRALVGRAARGRALAAAVVAAVVAAVLLAAALSRTVYFGSALEEYDGRDALATAAYILDARTREWGELVTNVPKSRVPAALAPVARAAGLAGLAVVLAGLASRRRELRALDVFVAAYLLLLFVWPFEDPRFWLPVLPYLAGYGAVAVERAAPRLRARRLVAAWLVLFAAAGVGALAYSTRLTLSGASFPDRYGDGTLTRTYRLAYGLPDPGDGVVVDRALAVLRRYDPRAGRRETRSRPQ